MKRFLLRLLIFTGLVSGCWNSMQAQTYNNEWIDYNKTYYKFTMQPLGSGAGIYRITQPILAANNLANVPAQQFQLWRDGQEVPIYTSVQTGIMGTNDYIEFRSEINGGKTDKSLYRDPDFQLNDKWSLETDTAAYFLTVNPSGNNLRLTPTVNNVAGNTLPIEPYFMYTAGYYAKDKINPGYAAIVGEYVYSSAYDQGEGWTTSDIGTGLAHSTVQANLNVYTGPGAPQSTFKINATGNALNSRNFEVKINGTSILTQTMDYFDYVKSVVPVSNSIINSGTANVDIINECMTPNDRMAVAQYELIYPRQFNFANARNFYFDLPANPNGNYLEISNFNYNFTAPILYDLTNGKRYAGDISNPALVKIALLPSSVDRKLVLVAEDNANVLLVPTLQQKNFLNITQAANQGDFIIISHPALMAGPSGSNPVNDYKAYRNSVAGGGYNTKVYMIDELVDQFAFGIKKDPLSIRNFLRWARANFSTPPKDVLLIGKGVTYDQYRQLEAEPSIDQLALVPTFGSPASDNLLSADPGDEIPKTPIGRLSVVSPNEVSIYLSKLKEYEQAQATSSPYIQDKGWMKTVVHVVGASDTVLQGILDSYMDRYKATISDTLYGGNVSTFSKTSAEAVQSANSSRITSLFESGIGLLTYFGHSSATTLEFNLDSPDQYNNQGKYPVMIALGCNAGNFFTYNLSRLQTPETLSEKYVLAPERGTIAFIASTHFGIVHYCDIVNTQTYSAAATNYYGRSLGDIMIETAREVYNITTQNDFYARFHCEQATLHGDPSIKLDASTPKPDYVIEQQLVKISPSFISVADTVFKVNAQFMNLGKAINKNIVVELKRTYPDHTTQVVRRDTIPGIRFIDSLNYSLPIIATRDKGLNQITITVDADNDVDELYENNNSVTKDVNIYEDEARPIYPYNLAIVNKQGIKLLASTANPFSLLKQYKVELDTTELFNSASKVTVTVSSTGGLLEFAPGINFVDSTVYYWRVAPVPTIGQPVWNTASFVYLANSDFGFNQSHLFQDFKSNMDRMQLDSVTRKWTYKNIANNLFIKSGVFPTSFNQADGFSIAVNGEPYIRSVCGVANIVFNVFDPITFKPWLNGFTDGVSPGQYGTDPVCDATRQYNFQFSIAAGDTNKRRKIVEFMDLIPSGYYVTVRNCSYFTDAIPGYNNSYASDWEGDTSFLGHGNSMYHRLLGQGFNTIDSFYRSRAFVFVYKKNASSTDFTPKYTFSDGISDPITLSVDCTTVDSLGFMTSPQFGPAKAWKQLKWRGAGEASGGDVPTVDVIGIRNDLTQTTLFSNLSTSQQDVDISSINAAVYPYVMLKLRTQDSIHFTPYQLRYWRLTYVPVPEGAIAPNIYLKTIDTLEVGQPLDFKVAFKNISDVPFDSMKLKIIITDKNNVPHTVPLSKRRPLPVNDTLQLSTLVNTSSLSGLNTLYIEANSDNDQPEQFHFNNFAYRNFYVKPDSLNPLLDVTFDGVHILNRDIVSSKPGIIVKLKDEAKWLVLDDTSLLNVQVKFPDGSTRRYSFNSPDTLQFTPAAQAPNPDNTATVNFKPYFAADGDYELIVTGKDKSGNTAGSIQYRVAFQVINKPMISNMMNYPNPFTSSTAFVFTITGSEVPQNIKIEIMTITGKIVREITKDELGPLHIGRNITEFKWDGTDQFGQKVGNGIYLYRVVTNLNGKALDKYKADDDNTDKYFNKGYGKMVLIR